jgi:hypothetical protein
MSLLVSDLKPGDRVLLNCPKSKMQTRREAVFEGVKDRRQVAQAVWTAGSAVTGRDWRRQFDRQECFAIFLLQTMGPGASLDFLNADGERIPMPARMAITELRGLFAVREDGTMFDDENRTVFIERRLAMAQG